MRIKAGDHAFDGVVDEFFLIYGFNIAAFDGFKNAGKALHFFERQIATRIARNRLHRHGRQCAGKGADCDPSDCFNALFHKLFNCCKVGEVGNIHRGA